MPAELLQGKEISCEIKEGLKKKLEKLISQKGRPPKLVAVQVGENEASSIYTRMQRKNSESLRIIYELKKFFSQIEEKELMEEIEALNKDETVDGIIVQEPLPPNFDRSNIITSIDPCKDVDGMHPENMGRIVQGEFRFPPCTPAAVMELLSRAVDDFVGKEVVMVGHSAIVGKPIALMLLDKLATVSVCHIGTSQANRLKQHVEQAEILIVAVGKPNLIKGDWIKQGAVVIDVGINRVGDKIVGDVEFEKAKERASFITPVPGGVGPLTVAMLLKNLVSAFELH